MHHATQPSLETLEQELAQQDAAWAEHTQALEQLDPATEIALPGDFFEAIETHDTVTSTLHTGVRA